MQTLIDAIKNRLLLQMEYDGGTRIVEPHCYGITTKGNPALRAYQIDGFSSTSQMGWKMFDMSNASNVVLLDKKFSGSRQGYKRNDKGMSKIFAQL
ncbi:MAG: hypothetical protein JNM78_10905 [Cyclobacteriaceae bacterium]|jgi:hypothetical protein|nr:hypothetical protein [Cyclobacteriaceae bacterium]